MISQIVVVIEDGVRSYQTVMQRKDHLGTFKSRVYDLTGIQPRYQLLIESPNGNKEIKAKTMASFPLTSKSSCFIFVQHRLSLLGLLGSMNPDNGESGYGHFRKFHRG